MVRGYKQQKDRSISKTDFYTSNYELFSELRLKTSRKGHILRTRQHKIKYLRSTGTDEFETKDGGVKSFLRHETNPRKGQTTPELLRRSVLRVGEDIEQIKRREKSLQRQVVTDKRLQTFINKKKQVKNSINDILPFGPWSMRQYR